MSGTTKKRRVRGKDRAPRACPPVSPEKAAANRANSYKQRPGKMTADEFQWVQNWKRHIRANTIEVLARKAIEVICNPALTFGDPRFDTATDWVSDRCGIPKETVQDLKLQAGAVPTIRFEIVRPDKLGE